MKLQPRTEREISELTILPKGWYPFTIAKAEEKVSKKGNDMIALNVKIYKGAGFVFVKDWLMDTDFGAGKLRNCAETCGLLESYNTGEMKGEDMDGCEGWAKIGIEKSKDDYPDKNKILDYRKEEPKQDVAPAGSAAEEDEIPF